MTAMGEGTEMVGRRRFMIAGLTAVSLGVVSDDVRAAGKTTDWIKAALQNVKDTACNVADIVAGMSGPIVDPFEREFVRAELTVAAGDSQRLLTTNDSTIFAAPSDWLYWSRVDTGGMDLSAAASTACELACEALDRYCESLEIGADAESLRAMSSRAQWQLQNMYCYIFFVAGIL